MSDTRPVERFLGEVDPAHGPFGLLGLRPGDYDSEVIREALRQRLAQLSRHRQAGSTEADEVRLALHVAAAQLSDREVRRQILRQQGAGADAGSRAAGEVSGASAGETARREPAGTPAVGEADADFREVVLRVLAHSGGWNEVAKRRLGGLAHAYGLDVADLRRVLSSVAREGRVSGGGGRRPVRERRVGTVDEATPVSGGRRAMVWGTVAMLLLTGAMSARLLSLVVGGSGGGHEARVERQASRDEANGDAAAEGETQERVEASTALSITETPEGEGRATPEALLDRLRLAAAALERTPGEASEVFVEVYAEVAARWTEIEPRMLQALRVELSAFLGAAIRVDRDAALAVGEAIVVDAERVASGERGFDRAWIARGAFSAGLLARLNRQDVITEIGSRNRAVLSRLSTDGTGAGRREFWSGVGLGLGAIARGYVGLSGESAMRSWLDRGWDAWLEVVGRVGDEAPEIGERLVLDAMEWAMIEGPDPSMSQPAHDLLGRLVEALDFSGEGMASERLVRWFDDGRIPTSALSLVTSRVVFSSLIPGFGPEMVLRPDATEASRSGLRDDYALKLGLPVSSDDQGVSDLWRARVVGELGRGSDAGDPMAALERTSVLALLNEAASQRWAGDDEGSVGTTRRASLQSAGGSAGVDLGPARLEQMTSPSRPPDGGWARRYLAAMRSAAARQALLNELRNGDRGPMGPTDADVLAEAAVVGGPIPLRRSAQDVVVQYSEDLFVVNALLEASPNAARTDDVSEMFEAVSGRALPGVDDPSWRVSARRALMERLVEMVGERVEGGVAALERDIRTSYEDRVVATGAAAGDGRRVLLATATPADLAAALRDSMVTHARRFSEGSWTIVPLHELERRHSARTGLARGALQEFAAAQLGLVEAMAYVVAAERASQAPQVASILGDLWGRRRAARHIFMQIEASEEALARLWLIRLGEDVS